ncbi:MAG TPA: phosphatase PAP2 family protein [Pyrinomonadaceae bacterium]|nr:phosphatase PAP2 family protein [Pyrinomonadaceae bacterium]
MRRNRRSQCLFGMILFALTTAITLHAQTFPEPVPTPSVTPSLEHQFFKNILSDQKAIWGAPRRLERSDMKWVVPSSVGLMALFTTDRITGDEMFKSNRQVKASRAISRAGSIYGLGAVATTFYLIGRKNNNYRARETGLLSAEALVNSVITEAALKGITQRARPSAGDERSEFFERGNSFPSGHSTQAWAVAAVIASEYKHRPAIQIAAYGIATAVSVARFTGHEHYLSDVLAGSALGYTIGKFVYNAHHRSSVETDDNDSAITKSAWPLITPQFNRHARQYGFALTWNF